LRETLNEGIDGVIKLLKGVEEKNPAGHKIEATKIRKGCQKKSIF